jgi:hypothetical protein
MIVRSMKKRLAKAEVYSEVNDPDKVVIRNIVDYYQYLEDLETDKELDKKEIIYKPPKRTSPKETFLDLLLKCDKHWAGYIGDEAVEKLCAPKEHYINEEINDEEDSDEDENPDEESVNPVNEGAEGNQKSEAEISLAKQLKEQEEKEKSDPEAEQPAEKIRRRKALECCGSYG